MTLDNKLEKLKATIDSYGQMLVALSGGVDSVFLLTFAYKIWGDDRVAALTASSPHFAPDEVEYAKCLCDDLGISHKTIDVSHILPIIENNPEDRCYICKKEIFSELKERADMVGSVLADGTNLDDMSDFRPGYKAICELGIASPLKEAGLTKSDIRTALKALAEEDPFLANALYLSEPKNSQPPSFSHQPGNRNKVDLNDSLQREALMHYDNSTKKCSLHDKENRIPMWEKPAFACLASRIPYGEKITVEKLEAIYDAELFLRSLGFSQIRVRHHGGVARIEVAPEDRNKFFDDLFMDKVNEGIKSCGFKFVALDLGGYKMGSLNV